jgi:VWFA-related protein
MRALIRSAAPAALAAAVLALAPSAPAAAAATEPSLWPEPQRAFFQDGPGLLLTDAERAELRALDAEGRAEWIAGFLGRDPDPATPLNELAEGVERRRQLAADAFLSPLDVRARLVFLNGAPAERLVIECGLTYKPLEIWSYPGRPGGPGAGQPQQLVVYRPGPDQPWRLWVPLESKRVLYTSEMEYWLQQADELRGRLRGPRFDKATCKETQRVDEATGVRALRDYREGRPLQSDYERFLAPPEDPAAWARAAAATALPEPPPRLAVEGVEVLFPERRNQRTVARAYVTLPAGSGVELTTEGGEQELQMAIDGVVEQEGEIFEEFRVRFRQERPDEATPIVLALERPLRADRAYVLRLAVSDEVGGGRTTLATGFEVPREATAVADPTLAGEVIEALTEDLAQQEIAGADSLILVPPPAEVVLGLWRAEALVTGSRIVEVAFSVDGQLQLRARRRPFSVELRLAEVPKEQVVRAEGYDAAGELVAADEVVINQPRGAFAVSIVEPGRGFTGSGPVAVRAEVVVPEERRVERVEFKLGDRTVAELERPPWEATVEVPVPVAGEVTYVTAVAYLDDGRSAEAVRFLNAPDFLEEVDVDLVELYAAVIDRSGRLVRGLGVDDFEVYEDGRRQEITKFELVEDLPLTVGIAIDISGSMMQTLGEAQRAGREFVGRMLRPGDRCFVVGFADRPELLMPPTDDSEACSEGLDDLAAFGYTALHDATVTSLYYFRGFRGQRALILLSDGDDTSSSVSYHAAIEYARRSGVAIYAVGLGTGGFLGGGVRGKLKELAEETGGRVFFIGRAEELDQVYDEIEQELRSRYLIAYQSDRPAGGGDEYREVEVKVEQRGLEARTIRGYYP